MTLQGKRLWSLWDLLVVEGGFLVRAVQVIETVALSKNVTNQEEIEFSHYIELYKNAIVTVLHIAEQMKANTVVVQCETALAQIRMSEGIDPQELFLKLHSQAGEITNRLRDHLLGTPLYFLELGELHWLQNCNNDDWITAFRIIPEIAEDVQNASKCLAFGHYTASVFHMMRAMEICVRKCGQELGVTVINKNNKYETWRQITGKLNQKIEKIQNNEEKAEWSSIYARLDAVALAWRNDTMHPKNTYDKAEAESIFRSCEAYIFSFLPKIS